MQARGVWLIHTAILGVLSLSLASCAGAAAPPPAAEPQPAASPPPPAAPASAEPEATAPAAAEASATSQGGVEPGAETPAADEQAGAAAEASEPDSPPSASAAMPTRSPSEVLTGSDVAFMFDYNGSDLKQEIVRKCSAKSDDDPQKSAECMQKERSKFRADVLSFRKGRNGQLRWVVYQRDRSTLAEVHDCQIKFADETAKLITVVPTGRGKGTRPLFKGRGRFVVEVPNGYSIVLNDPEYGRLPYDAKVGLVGQR